MCRGSYINPRAVELFREGTTIAPAVTRVQRGMAGATSDGRIPPDRLPVIGAAPSIERAVLKLLAD